LTAASLGQVHKAHTDNQDLAIKIQYPGIKKSLDIDMKMLTLFLKKFAKSKKIEHLSSEIRDRLFEEIDYIKEANNMQLFRDHFFKNNLDLDGLVIPKVFRKYSSEKVLCTQYIEGNTLQELLSSNPTQKSKNRYAQILFDSFFICLYELKQIHADPNPGNFIFLPEDRLAMIDFGCVKKIEDDFLKAYSKIHVLLFEKAPLDDIISCYTELGMIDEKNDTAAKAFYLNTIQPLDSLYIGPFYADTFDFSNHKNFSKKGYETIVDIQKNQDKTLQQLNQDFVFLDRTLLGYYAIFEKLGAVVDLTLAKKLMKEGI